MKLATDTAAQSVAPAALAFGNGYENNFSNVQANIAREVYAETYAHLQAICRVQMQGVIEVTLRTRTGCFTVPLSSELSQQITQQITESIGDELSTLEAEILRYDSNAKQEGDDVEGTSDRAKVFAFCLPMRPLNDAEFSALAPEAQRVFDEQRAEQAKAA